MSLDGVGFGEGEERFPSMISLKLLFPTFLASCRTETKKKVCITHLCCFRDQTVLTPRFYYLQYSSRDENSNGRALLPSENTLY